MTVLYRELAWRSPSCGFNQSWGLEACRLVGVSGQPSQRGSVGEPNPIKGESGPKERMCERPLPRIDGEIAHEPEGLLLRLPRTLILSSVQVLESQFRGRARANPGLRQSERVGRVYALVHMMPVEPCHQQGSGDVRDRPKCTDDRRDASLEQRAGKSHGLVRDAQVVQRRLA